MKNVSKIKLNLVKEKLYLEGMVNKLYEDIANFGEGEMEAKPLIETLIREEKGKSIIGDIVDELRLAPKFIFSFGTGIGAFYEPVRSLLEGSGFKMTEYEIYLLIITAVALLINEVDSEKLVNKVKEMGLFSALSPVKEYILNSKKLINSVVKNVLGVSYGLTDILGFTVLLVPTMNLLTNVINDYGLTSNNLSDMLKGVILSTSVYGIKSVIKKIKNKIN